MGPGMFNSFTLSSGHLVLKGALIASVVSLAGCENLPEQLRPKASTTPPSETASLVLEERDRVSPDVFNLRDMALWDGRPSFGGVWVAVASNVLPERVRITNTVNGKTSVGALFKREEENPGPPIRLSSDAAAALGVIPGEPTLLEVTAIRREPVAVAAPVTPVAQTPADVAQTTLAPVPAPDRPAIAAPVPVPVDPPKPAAEVASGIAATIEAAPASPDLASPAPASTAPQTATTPPAAPQPSAADAPDRPYIQVGTFRTRKNADTLVLQLAEAGIGARVASSETQSGRTLFRVLAGPAADDQSLSDLSNTISKLGHKDAFPVVN